MKIVINCCYGVFRLPEELVESLGAGCVYDVSDEIRTNSLLVDWVESHSKETSLHVVFIPANATDYRIIEYDGFEYVIFVQDGKMYEAC